jgi:tripartite ATP-independent transporter DctP family solute receptor
LAVTEPPEGTFIMFSAGTGESALDHLGAGDNDPNSVYTRQLLPLLKAPGVSLTEVAEQVRVGVRQMTSTVQHRQTPAYYNQVLGRVCLAGGDCAGRVTIPVLPAPAPPHLSEAERTWAAVKETTDRSVLEAYVRQFGDTVYGAMARARIEEIKKQQIAVAEPPKAPISPPGKTSAIITQPQTQPQIVLKASDVHPPGHPTVEAVVLMGKKLQTASNARIGIQMYPSMQLGGEKEMIEQAQAGALQIARISAGPMASFVPEFNVFNLPFMFRDKAHFEKVIDGPIGDELLRKLTDDANANLIGLCWMNAGARNIYNSKQPITKVEDLKGLKIRVMANPVFVESMNSLGGKGVAMGFEQLINAMQTRVIDGAENNEPTYESGQHYRHAKFYSMTGHLVMPEVLVYSKRSWETLSKNDQALITQFAKEAQQEQRKLWYEYEAAALKKMRDAGVQVSEVVDRRTFQAAVKPVWDKYGAQQATLIQRIQNLK